MMKHFLDVVFPSRIPRDRMNKENKDMPKPGQGNRRIARAIILCFVGVIFIIWLNAIPPLFMTALAFMVAYLTYAFFKKDDRIDHKNKDLIEKLANNKANKTRKRKAKRLPH